MSVRISAKEYRSTASERDVQKAICDLLDAYRIPYSVTDASRTFGPDGKPRKSKVRRGWPDITGVLPDGRALLIEVKRPKGWRYQPGQREMLERLRATKAIVLLARGPGDVIAALQQEGYR